MPTALTIEQIVTQLFTNAKSIITTIVVCQNAGQAYQLPHIQIINGKSVLLKSHPSNAPGSFVLIGRSPPGCLNLLGAYPLAVNESISYMIQDTVALYVSSTVAGSVLVITAEQ